MRVAIVGLGELGVKHLECLQSIQDVDVVALAGNGPDHVQAIGKKFGVPFCSTRLEDILSREDVDAIILCTPVHAHVDQAVAAMRSGKHVLVETALANSLEGVESIAAVHRETRRAVMAGHTHRYSPAHHWIHQRVLSGDLQVQQLVVEGHFLQSNCLDAVGESRCLDGLLWGQSVAAVDLLEYQTGHRIAFANAVESAVRPDDAHASQLGVQLLTVGQEIAMVSLRFSSDGPPCTSFRYVCDHGIYVVRGDALFNGMNEPVELDSPLCGIDIQNREFLDAVTMRRKPASGISDVLDCYRVLSSIDEQLAVRRAQLDASD